MTKRSATLKALSSLIVLAFIGVIGCLVQKSDYASFTAEVRQTINERMKLLEEQKYEGPAPLTPLNITIDSVESETHSAGKGGGG